MNLKHSVLAAAVFASASIIAAPAALAATVSAPMPVTITIQNACNVSSVAPTAMAFGTQGPLVAAVNQTSTITVTCTKNWPYNIALDGGTSGNINARTMVNGANTVGYQLYSDTGRTTVWGNTVSSNTVPGTGTGSAQAFTVYGQVPAQATPPAATYTDTVNVTVTY